MQSNHKYMRTPSASLPSRKLTWILKTSVWKRLPPMAMFGIDVSFLGCNPVVWSNCVFSFVFGVCRCFLYQRCSTKMVGASNGFAEKTWGDNKINETTFKWNIWKFPSFLRHTHIINKYEYIHIYYRLSIHARGHSKTMPVTFQKGKSVIRQCLTVESHWRPPVRAIMLHESWWWLCGVDGCLKLSWWTLRDVKFRLIEFDYHFWILEHKVIFFWCVTLKHEHRTIVGIIYMEVFRLSQVCASSTNHVDVETPRWGCFLCKGDRARTGVELHDLTMITGVRLKGYLIYSNLMSQKMKKQIDSNIKLYLKFPMVAKLRCNFPENHHFDEISVFLRLFSTMM